MAFKQTEQLISITTSLGADKLLLRSVRGEARISGLFQFFPKMQSEEKSLDFAKIVGKTATVAIKLADGTTRYVNGIPLEYCVQYNETAFAFVSRAGAFLAAG
jgi:type VI secretion system secreted protein VgrG